MDSLEKIEKIKTFQDQIRKVQESLTDTVLSEGGELQVVMNGNIQILEIKWLTPISDGNKQTQILINTINRAILSVNLRLKQSMQQITQSMNLPNVGV
jgi:DNA-binding protein YbaB